MLIQHRHLSPLLVKTKRKIFLHWEISQRSHGIGSLHLSKECMCRMWYRPQMPRHGILALCRPDNFRFSILPKVGAVPCSMGFSSEKSGLTRRGNFERKRSGGSTVQPWSRFAVLDVSTCTINCSCVDGYSHDLVLQYYYQTFCGPNSIACPLIIISLLLEEMFVIKIVF